MKITRTLLAVASAVGLLGAAAPSFAFPTLTFKDGASTYSVDPFGGIDWNSNASAVSDLPVYDNTTVLTTTYLANAVGVKLVGGGGAIALLGTAVDPYEFTIKATLKETVSCLLFAGPVCQLANFTAVAGGTYDVYYDSVANSNKLNGTGFINGTKIISGTIDSGGGLFSIFTLSGNFSFNGAVTFTETDSTKAAYFYPELASSKGTATLQFGGALTDWTQPTSWVDGGSPVLATKLVFQADGNQSFTSQPVPEPATLALVGLSLVGLAATRRRRSA